MTWLFVALGAAVGAPARHLVDAAVRRRWPGQFPWGTLVVNVSGCLLLGVVAGAGVGPPWAALLATGLCGAFTTWSTLALDVVMLAKARASRTAVLDALASLIAGLAAVTVGIELGALL